MFNPSSAQRAVDSLGHERGFEQSFPHAFGETQASPEHPNRNEDAIFVEESAIGVFDGVGGNKGSEVAAYIACEYCRTEIKTIPEIIDPQEAAAILAELLREASQAIGEYQPDRTQRISTAALLAVKRIDPATMLPYVAEAHAGDVRMNHLRDGKSIFSTLDHSGIGQSLPAQEARAIQNYLDTVEDEEGLFGTKIGEYDATFCFSLRNTIASSLGNSTDPKDIDIRTSLRPARTGDLFIVTSDGAHDNLTNREFEAAVQSAKSPSEVPDKIIIAAEKRSYDKTHIRSKADDITAGVLVG